MFHKYFIHHGPFVHRKENTNKKNTFYLYRMKKVNVYLTLNSNEKVFSPVWHQIWR